MSACMNKEYKWALRKLDIKNPDIVRKVEKCAGQSIQYILGMPVI